MPNRLAACLPPIDSPSLTASTLNSSVYCRFATNSFLPISPFVHQKFTRNLMYVKPGQGHTAFGIYEARQGSGTISRITFVPKTGEDQIEVEPKFGARA